MNVYVTYIHTRTVLLQFIIHNTIHKYTVNKLMLDSNLSAVKICQSVGVLQMTMKLN
jgi:hypothetical protein